MEETINDVIIIGGGPAGLTAGIYSSRERLGTLLLEKAACGGWPTVAGEIENYPGFPEGINGLELGDKFKEQAEKFGVEIREFMEVKGVKPDGDKIVVETEKGEYGAKAVVIATGSRHRKLGVPGEEEFLGKGVSYCATCDGPLFRDRNVAVVGGGNAALEEALFLTKFASRVYLVHRRDEFRGARILADRLKENPKVEFVLNALPVSINGEERVASITVRDKPSGEERKIDLAGVFVFVGVEPNSDFLKGVIDLDESGRVVTDAGMRASRPGLFAAGDVRAGNLRQITIACGEGATAALSVREYLEGIGSGEPRNSSGSPPR